MGQGLTLLAPELAQRLSSDRLATFYECEANAEETNMNSVETYLFLTAKYEQLLREQHDADLQAEQDRIAMEKNNAEIAARAAPVEAAEYRAKVAQMCRFSSPMQKRTTRTPVISCSVKEKSQPALKTTDKQSSTKCIDDTTITHESEEITEHVEETVHITSALPKVSFSEQQQFACKLCNKDFASQRQLDNHIGHSQLHAKALKQRNLRLAEAYEHAQKLSQTLRRIASGFIHVKTLSQSVPSSGRERFIRAVKRVIDANRLLRFKVEFPDFKADQPKLTEATAGSEEDQKVIYEGTKFFWRVKSTCRVLIVSHVTAGVLEMITHPLPTSLDELTLTTTGSDDKAHGVEHDDVGEKHSTKVSHSHKSHYHNGVHHKTSNKHHGHTHTHGHHAGEKKQEGGDKEGAEVQRIYLHTQIIRELALPDCRDTAIQQPPLQSEEQVEAEHKLIASFLLSRLKIDYLRRRDHTLQAFSFYFDTPLRDASNTPLIGLQPPEGLLPYPKVDVKAVHKQWQLALRMKAIERSQQKMAVAVARQHNMEHHHSQHQLSQAGGGGAVRVKTPHHSHSHHHVSGSLRYSRRYKTLANAPTNTHTSTSQSHGHEKQEKEAREEHHRLLSEKFPRNDHINPALPPVDASSYSMKKNMSRPLASLSDEQQQQQQNDEMIGLTLPSLASRSMDNYHGHHHHVGSNPFDPSTQASQQLQKQLSYQEQRKRSLTRQYTKVSCLSQSQSRSRDDHDHSHHQTATGGSQTRDSSSQEERTSGENERALYLDDNHHSDLDDDLVDELPVVMPLTARDRSSSSSNYNTSGESNYVTSTAQQQHSTRTSSALQLPPIACAAAGKNGSRSTSIDSVENNSGSSTTNTKPALPAWMSWKLHGDYEIASMNELASNSPEAPVKEEGRPVAARLSPLNPARTGRRWTFDA